LDIRLATADDIPALRAIAADAYAQYVGVIGAKPARALSPMSKLVAPPAISSTRM
jgi:hypothetical protein